MNNIVENYNISQEFIGIILIPLLGSFGENAASIVCAIDNKIDCSLETAIGSSIQISLFNSSFNNLFCSYGIKYDFGIFNLSNYNAYNFCSYVILWCFKCKTYWLEGGVLTVTYIIITIALLLL